jgi:blue copper oxidase
MEEFVGSGRVCAAPLSRRRALRAMAALGLAFFARPAQSDQATSNKRPANWCGTGKSARPLFIPRDEGYLGRLALRGAPLALAAAPAGALPAGIVHGPLAYRARHRERDYLNPTLVLRRGERVRIALANRLKEPTIAHWHGLSVDARNDGNGLTLIAPGETYDYDFEVRDRGALYWYHPHPHGTTGRQTYGGLFGLIDVEDDDVVALRKALDLTPGRTEIVLALQDRRANPAYSPTPADLMHGFFGDELCINGRSCAFLDVASRLYRFRMVSACNARTLRLAFRTASGARMPFTVIGIDGGLMPAAVRAEQAFLSPAERLDVLLDLRDAVIGDTVVLETLAFDPMHNEMAGGAASASAGHDATAHAPASTDHAHVHARHHAGSTWPEGAPRPLLELRVRQRVTYDRALPAVLSKLTPIDVSGARERPLRLGFNKGRWRINDRVFAMGETPIEVVRDTTEVWLLRNYHTSMPHAMHLHGFHFEVLERETSPDFVGALAVDDQGRLASDLGRRDTVLVWPGESLRLAINFAMPFAGPQIYMFHCHNMEHEDGGMMLGVKVT